MRKIAILCVILGTITGCSKNISIHSADSEIKSSSETIANSQVSSDIKSVELECPEAGVDNFSYRYSVFDDFYIEHEQEALDGEQCSDAQKYCYGHDNRPILRPNAPDGWICRYVLKMPGYQNDMHEYVYFEHVKSYMDEENSLHRHKRKYSQWAFLKSWVCNNEAGCQCGGSFCPHNGLCVDEKCYCNDELYTNGQCSIIEPVWKNKAFGEWDNNNEIKLKYDYNENGVIIGEVVRDGFYYYVGNVLTQYSFYYTSRKPKYDKNGEMIKNDYDFYCNGTKIENPLLQHCMILPDGRIALHFEIFDEWYLDEYLDETVCCDGPRDECDKNSYYVDNRADIEAERKYRHGDPLYACGDETCVMGETCVDNHCVGMGTLKPLPSNDYTWTDYLPMCKLEGGCTCASSQCKINQYCTDEGCIDNPYRRKVNGKWIKYGSIMTDYYNINYSTGDDGEDAAVRNYDVLSSALWFDVLTDREAEACDNFAMPDNVEDYLCVYDGREDGCGEAPQMYVSIAGYRCINPDGCRCGDTIIPMHAGCRDGKADYDALYQTMACHHEMNYYMAEDGVAVSKLVDDKGWCKCGVSTVPPNTKGFMCEHATAMICKLHSGCKCGEATCQYDEVCVKPGVCRE